MELLTNILLADAIGKILLNVALFIFNFDVFYSTQHNNVLHIAHAVSKPDFMYPAEKST